MGCEQPGRQIEETIEIAVDEIHVRSRIERAAQVGRALAQNGHRLFRIRIVQIEQIAAEPIREPRLDAMCVGG